MWGSDEGKVTEIEEDRAAACAGDTMPELTEGGFEMLQVAVRLARDKQIKTVALLRAALVSLCGGDRSGDIDQALRYWAARLAVVGVHD